VELLGYLALGASSHNRRPNTNFEPKNNQLFTKFPVIFLNILKMVGRRKCFVLI
jgi:hypothetical protein